MDEGVARRKMNRIMMRRRRKRKRKNRSRRMKGEQEEEGEQKGQRSLECLSEPLGTSWGLFSASLRIFLVRLRASSPFLRISEI